NIKRLAYEVAPVVSRWDRASGLATPAPSSALPKAPEKAPAPTGISAEALSKRIDQFLGSRGFRSGTEEGRSTLRPSSVPPPSPVPLDFVCEEDVRLAIQAGTKLVLSERAIVTPAARDLGEQHRVFSVAPWRG